MGVLRSLLVYALIIAASVAAFDIAAYFLLPASFNLRFIGYRSPAVDTVGIGDNPRDYYRADPALGFDIVPDRRGQHVVDGLVYPVWSNSFGCFDREHTGERDYVYLAGDSFAWGFAPFDDKIGTVLERELGRPVVKCGVTHTGTRHEYEKLRRTVDRLGAPPSTIVVLYCFNDVDNDFAFPHSTVIDGWLADNVFLRRGADGRFERFVLPEAVVREAVAARVAEAGRWQTRFEAWRRRYSLVYNLWLRLRAAPPLPPADAQLALSYDGQKLYNLYRLSTDAEQAGVIPYRDSPYAEPNKAAIRDMAGYARTVGARLLFVLIPPRSNYDNTGFFVELRDFLADEGIATLDLARSFAEAGLPLERLYWPVNGHFNVEGNHFVADRIRETLTGMGVTAH